VLAHRGRDDAGADGVDAGATLARAQRGRQHLFTGGLIGKISDCRLLRSAMRSSACRMWRPG
jgi:hypothetical protein